MDSIIPLGLRIMQWYERNGRNLPWRKDKNPYRVWISEVMLQQTRVETVIPYFKRWMKRFPNIKSLAESTENDVLSVWEGLGYYSRAHNLLKTARIIMREFGGKFPRNLESLKDLPGLGAYSSAAIASIAYNENQPAIDGNIRRVYSRLFDNRISMKTSLFERRIRRIAEQNLPHGRAGDFNQALMDFGAMICLPKQPKCTECPLEDRCLAFRRGVQNLLPMVGQATPIPHEQQAAAIIIHKRGKLSKVLLRKRSSKGLLAGLWEFSSVYVNTNQGQELARRFLSTFKLKLRKKSLFTTVKHSYSHFRVTLSAYAFTYNSGKITKDFKWVDLGDLSEYPMGKVNRLIADQLVLNPNDR